MAAELDGIQEQLFEVFEQAGLSEEWRQFELVIQNGFELSRQFIDDVRAAFGLDPAFDEQLLGRLGTVTDTLGGHVRSEGSNGDTDDWFQGVPT